MEKKKNDFGPVDRQELSEKFHKEDYLKDLKKGIENKNKGDGINWGTINRKPEYAADGIVTIHTCNFREDAQFKEAKMVATKETDFPYEIDWRLHTALWAAQYCSQLKGDFIECGVDKGFLSRAIVQYINWNNLNKKFYLIDTFEGIPLEYVTKKEFKINPHVNLGKEHFIGSYEKAKQVFKGFKDIELIRGKVPDILSEVKTNSVAYLSLDMNNAYPEVKAAEFFWDKIVKGGIILLDDYCRNVTYEVQRKAFDKFAKEKGVIVLSLATGQGLIIKP